MVYAERCNIDIIKLLLWEALLGNWGAVGNSESDIAIEEVNPYDSHYIYEILLSLRKEQGNIFEAMIKKMWPELLEFPFNPPQSVEDKMKAALDHMGMYRVLKQIKYRLDRWKFKKL